MPDGALSILPGVSRGARPPAGASTPSGLSMDLNPGVSSLFGASMSEELAFRTVTVERPDDINFILGQSHFIKTVEDIAEAVIGSVPGARFGLAFCESSGECLVRIEGNDDELKALASENALAIGAGHSFILFLRDCFPINVLNAIKDLQEVCSIYCATANPAEVIVAESATGRGIMGVIDGARPKGVEGPDGVAWRTGLLRKFGYKRG